LLKPEDCLFWKWTLRTQFKEIKNALEVHDSQLNQIYDAIENLLDENAALKKWETRERIGFKK
jgi:hypothetical protein